MAVVFILWPRNWEFHLNAKTLVRDYVDDPERPDACEMQRNLALELEVDFQTNKTKLRGLYRAFRVGSFLLGLSVVAWIVDLAIGSA